MIKLISLLPRALGVFVAISVSTFCVLNQIQSVQTWPVDP